MTERIESTIHAGAGIEQALDRVRAAWDAGDAAAYAECFTTDATYVIFVGLVHHGRDEIREGHVPVFERWQRGTRMSMRILDVRMVDSNTAVVLTEGGIGRRHPIRHDKVQTFVMVRESDGWRCAAFQNTKRNRVFIRMNARAMRRIAATAAPAPSNP